MTDGFDMGKDKETMKQNREPGKRSTRLRKSGVR